MSDKKTQKIISRAIGRRKEAIASVRIISGNGEIIVNGKDAKVYFPGRRLESRYLLPFKSTSVSKYSIVAKVNGGGIFAQADALVLGISRALSKIKDEYKVTLRAVGLLTRDPRERQRRMVGTGGKSRRKKQSPKR